MELFLKMFFRKERQDVHGRVDISWRSWREVSFLLRKCSTNNFYAEPNVGDSFHAMETFWPILPRYGRFFRNSSTLWKKVFHRVETSYNG